jgi:hypothetical protein
LFYTAFSIAYALSYQGMIMYDQVNPEGLESRIITSDDPVELMRRRVGRLDPVQVKIWRQMTPVQKAALVFQSYRFALEMVRTSERRRHPDLSPEELAWRVTRRMQGNPRLGKSQHGTNP